MVWSRQPCGPQLWAVILLLATAAGIFVYMSHAVFMKELYCMNLSAISPSGSDAQGEQKLQDLIASLQEGNSYDRQRAAIALGAMGEAKSVEPLIKALADEDNFVRDFAARALGNIGDSRAVAPLIKALDDENLLVRRSAALALGILGDPGAVDPLIKALDSEDYMVQRAAAKALGDLGDPGAVDPLIKELGSEDIYIQNGAAIALAHLDGIALPKLVRVLADWKIGPRVAGILKDSGWQSSSIEDKVRYDVAMRNKQSLLDNWDIVKEVLINDTNSENNRVVQNAVFALIGIGRDEVINELVGILDKKGNAEMARAFLDCGNHYLFEAARNWAKKHGSEIMKEDENPIVEWGGMKSD